MAVVVALPQAFVDVLGEDAVCAIVKKHNCDGEKSFAEVVASVEFVNDTLALPMIQPMVARVTKEKCVEIILNEENGPDFVKNVQRNVATIFCKTSSSSVSVGGTSQSALGGAPSLGAKPAGLKISSDDSSLAVPGSAEFSRDLRAESSRRPSTPSPRRRLAVAETPRTGPGAGGLSARQFRGY